MGKRSWRSRDCQSRTSIATGARGLRKGFDDAEGVNPSVEVMPVNDEQEEHVQELPINEPISTRLLSYELNERWETDDEIRRKAMDVGFFVIFVAVHIFHI